MVQLILNLFKFSTQRYKDNYVSQSSWRARETDVQLRAPRTLHSRLPGAAHRPSRLGAGAGAVAALLYTLIRVLVMLALNKKHLVEASPSSNIRGVLLFRRLG